MYTEQELVQMIEENDMLYWNGTPVISDEDYDDLVNQLTKINPTNPLITRINSTSVASAKKVLHTEPMLSLEKAYS